MSSSSQKPDNSTGQIAASISDNKSQSKLADEPKYFIKTRLRIGADKETREVVATHEEVYMTEKELRTAGYTLEVKESEEKDPKNANALIIVITKTVKDNLSDSSRIHQNNLDLAIFQSDLDKLNIKLNNSQITLRDDCTLKALEQALLAIENHKQYYQNYLYKLEKQMKLERKPFDENIGNNFINFLSRLITAIKNEINVKKGITTTPAKDVKNQSDSEPTASATEVKQSDSELTASATEVKYTSPEIQKQEAQQKLSAKSQLLSNQVRELESLSERAAAKFESQIILTSTQKQRKNNINDFINYHLIPLKDKTKTPEEREKLLNQAEAKINSLLSDYRKKLGDRSITFSERLFGNKLKDSQKEERAEIQLNKNLSNKDPMQHIYAKFLTEARKEIMAAKKSLTQPEPSLNVTPVAKRPGQP